jgi:hypothetical protein
MSASTPVPATATAATAAATAAAAAAATARVQRMVNFPDFEEQFELFEELGALHVSINMAGVSRAHARSQLLLTGLQLPILNKVRGEG